MIMIMITIMVTIKVMKENIELVIIIMLMASLLITLVLWSVIITYDESFIRPLASQDAQNICESKGYDTYDTYDRLLFGTKALGVKCNYIKNRQEILSNRDVGVIAVTS